VGKSVRRSSTCPPKLEQQRRKSEGGMVPTVHDETADEWWTRREMRLLPILQSPFRFDFQTAKREAFAVTSPNSLPLLVMPRQRVGAKRRPMTGSGGASSTPRLLGSITDVSGILVHPPEPVIRPANGRTGWRVMTVGVAATASRSRRRFARGMTLNFPPSHKRGRRESRVPTAPAVRVQQKSTRQNHRYRRIIRPSLRNGFTAYT
jgi:hypothetical protein